MHMTPRGDARREPGGGFSFLAFASDAALRADYFHRLRDAGAAASCGAREIRGVVVCLFLADRRGCGLGHVSVFAVVLLR